MGYDNTFGHTCSARRIDHIGRRRYRYLRLWLDGSSGLKHVFGKHHGSQKGTFEIEVEHLVETSQIKTIECVRQIIPGAHLLNLAGSFRRVATRAVDKDVDLSEFLMDQIQGSLKGGLVQGAR